MTLCTEALGGERVVRVGLCGPILQASLCHGLASEDISIHNVEGAPVEAHVVSHHKVARSKESAVRLLHAVPPNQDTLHSASQPLSAGYKVVSQSLSIRCETYWLSIHRA